MSNIFVLKERIPILFFIFRDYTDSSFIALITLALTLRNISGKYNINF